MRRVILIFVLLAAGVAAFAQEAFITIWDTRNSAPGNVQVIYPGIGEDYAISWQELEPGNATGNTTGTNATTIVFPNPGKYRISVAPGDGTFTGFKAGSDEDDNFATPDLAEVQQWGNIAWQQLEKAFMGCINMELTATDHPDLSGVTSLYSMFRKCYSMTAVGSSITNWVVSNITNMESMFEGASVFNQPLSWNVSNVTTFRSMFSGTVFNQPLNGWILNTDVNKTVDLSWMFANNHSFNHPLNSWNTSRVTDIAAMFTGTSFNQDISSWDVSNVTNFDLIFWGSSFNQPLNSWVTTSAQRMWGTFGNTSAFNRPLSNWNVSGVTTFEGMFENAAVFNQPLGSWNIASAENMLQIFDNSAMSCLNYGATLKGWANNMATPLNLTLGAAGLTYGPAGQVAHSRLTGSKGWTITGDNLDNNCNDASLPVTFGAIEAFIKNGMLTVNWTSLTETSNHYYEVEVSTDGLHFQKIGKAILSKVKDGNSGIPLNYSFSYQAEAGLLGIGLAGFAAMLLFGKRRKLTGLFMIFAVLSIGYISCNKSALDTVEASGKKLFIRIVQVDKDGAKMYTKVVEVVDRR